MFLPLAAGALLLARAHADTTPQLRALARDDSARLVAPRVAAPDTAGEARISDAPAVAEDMTVAMRWATGGEGAPLDWGVTLAGAPVLREAPVIPAVDENAVPRLPRPGVETAVRAAAPRTGSARFLLPAQRRDTTAADSVVVEKSAHLLSLYRRGVLLRSYAVALGQNPVGDKQYAGDQRTPEGFYRIAEQNPVSRFHLGLRISYPDSAHRARAAAMGRAPGGNIEIHGLPRGFEDLDDLHREEDWTDGCIALTNEQIEEIWRLVPLGTRIQIKP